MTPSTSDAQLVAGHLAGDPAALAGIYDRYADSLHDTAAAMLNDRSEAADVLQDVILIAAERLGQLRDPNRLKPWLFAILRNEVYRRTKKRRQTIVTDFTGTDHPGSGIDMADRGADPGDTATDEIDGEDLAELVRNAARGLDERDQLVLELSVRQGLTGTDLADALGVSANQSYTLVHRMRERVEKSLSAYVVARAGRKDCDALDRILADWDGEFSVLIRKRVARHIEACSTCDRRRKTAVPFALFAAAPAYAAPSDLRDRILAGAYRAPATPYKFVAQGGFPTIVRSGAKIAAWVAPLAAAGLLLLAIVTVVAWPREPAVDEVATAPITIEATTTTATGTFPPSTTIPTSQTTAVDPVATDPTAVAPPQATRVPSGDGPATTAETPDAARPAASVPPTTQAPATSPPRTTSAPRPASTAPPAPTPTQPPPTPTTAAPPTPTSTLAPTPGSVLVASSSIDLGASNGSGSVTVSNPGDLPVDFTVSGGTGSFAVSPASGTLQPGAGAQITASIDRSSLPEGDVSGGPITISGGGTSGAVSLSARVERPPAISGVAGNAGCAAGTPAAFVSANAIITDESGVSASVSFSGPNGQSGSASMGPDGGRYYGSTSFPFGTNPTALIGTWNFTISATDSRGNSASASGTTFITSCP